MKQYFNTKVKLNDDASKQLLKVVAKLAKLLPPPEKKFYFAIQQAPLFSQEYDEHVEVLEKGHNMGTRTMSSKLLNKSPDFEHWSYFWT